MMTVPYKVGLEGSKVGLQQLITLYIHGIKSITQRAFNLIHLKQNGKINIELLYNIILIILPILPTKSIHVMSTMFV